MLNSRAVNRHRIIKHSRSLSHPHVITSGGKGNGVETRVSSQRMATNGETQCTSVRRVVSGISIVCLSLRVGVL